MDLWQLHIFVSVVENKSFSKASIAINLSQPTVSSHIKELEDYFNIYDEKCKRMTNLSDHTFEKWIRLETELKQAKRKHNNENTLINLNKVKQIKC